MTPEGFAYAFFMANNGEGMAPHLRMAQEFAGVEASLFRGALARGHSEYEVRSHIEDAYYDRDLETVRQELRRIARIPVLDLGEPRTLLLTAQAPGPHFLQYQFRSSTRRFARMLGVVPGGDATGMEN